MDDRKTKWDESYSNKDNFVFYPHEEVIRFVSKNIRKKTGLDEHMDVYHTNGTVKVLDLGCGIGRHVIYCNDMGLDAYGVDLSIEAVEFARKWATDHGMNNVEEKIQQGDVRNLEWDDQYFDFAVSHGVLDSMSLDIAEQASDELSRVLKPNGLFYCDLISGDNSSHCREFSGEEVMQTSHENGTVQLFYNYSLIKELFDKHYKLVECNLVRRENVISGGYTSRYHLVLQKR